MTEQNILFLHIVRFSSIIQIFKLHSCYTSLRILHYLEEFLKMGINSQEIKHHLYFQGCKHLVTNTYICWILYKLTTDSFIFQFKSWKSIISIKGIYIRFALILFCSFLNTEGPCLMRLLVLGKICISQIFALCYFLAISLLLFALCKFWAILLHQCDFLPFLTKKPH